MTRMFVQSYFSAAAAILLLLSVPATATATTAEADFRATLTLFSFLLHINPTKVSLIKCTFMTHAVSDMIFFHESASWECSVIRQIIDNCYGIVYGQVTVTKSELFT